MLKNISSHNRLGVASKTALPDLLQKVEPLLLSSTLNPD